MANKTGNEWKRSDKIALVTLIILAFSLTVQYGTFRSETEQNKAEIVYTESASKCPDFLKSTETYGYEVDIQNIGRSNAGVEVALSGQNFVISFAEEKYYCSPSSSKRDINGTWAASKSYAIASSQSSRYCFYFNINVTSDSAPITLTLNANMKCNGDCKISEYALSSCNYQRNETKERQDFNQAKYYQLVR